MWKRLVALRGCSAFGVQNGDWFRGVSGFAMNCWAAEESGRRRTEGDR